jgi:CBS domain-containing protein
MNTLSASTQQPATNPFPADPDRLATSRFLSAVVRDRQRGAGPQRAAVRVRDVMHPGVVAAHEEAAFKEVVDAIIRNRISAVPVIDQQRRVVGVVSESDLLGRIAGAHMVLPTGDLVHTYATRQRALRGTTARDLMTAPAVVTTPDATVESAAHLSARRHVRRLPVVSEEHVLVGMVTRADLLRVFLRPDEEIGAEVRDEFHRIAPPADEAAVDITVAEGVVTLTGTVERRALAETIARFARSVSGVIAVDGSQLSYPVDRRADVPA